MKNINMVRTVHTVKRVVIFDRSDDSRTFITLYQDLFHHAKDERAWNHDGYAVHNHPDQIEVHFTIKKSDFDGIVKNLGLKRKTTVEWIYS